MRRLLPAAIILALATPTSASATDTLTITPPPNPAAETTVSVLLTGSTEPEESGQELAKVELWAVRNASTCEMSGFNYLLAGAPGAETFLITSGPFSTTAQLAIKQPGPYLLCGYLAQSFDKEAGASAVMTVGPSPAELESQAKKAAEAQAQTEAQAEQAAETKAREQAELAPASLLRVSFVPHFGEYSSNPGHTRITVTATPYAHITITLNHHGGTYRYRAPGSGGVAIGWSCRHLGLTYHYVVTAVGGSGPPLSRRGSFRVPLTASMCYSDARRSEQRRRQEAREEEERKHKEESPQVKIEEHEREYCEKVLKGGPAGITVIGGHVYLRCHIYKTETHPAETIIVSESTIAGQ